MTASKRKTVAEHAADILRETNNPGVCWGDCGLLDLIFVRAKMRRPKPTNGRTWVSPSLGHKRVLDALEGSPLFEKKYTAGSGSRSFYLKEPTDER